jgi:hypothetical protein
MSVPVGSARVSVPVLSKIMALTVCVVSSTSPLRLFDKINAVSVVLQHPDDAAHMPLN